MTEKDTHIEESSLFYFLRLVFANWKFLLGLYIVTGVITVIVLLLLPKWYKSDATIVILDDSSSSLSNMFSEFSAFGFNLGGATNVETYMQYVNTRKMYDRLIDEFNLMEEYEVKVREDAYDIIFNNLGVHDNENRTFNISFAFKENPEKARDIVNFIYEELDKITLEVDKAQASNFRRYIEDYYQQTRNKLKSDEDSLVSFQKKTGLLSLNTQVEATLQGIAELELQKIKLEIERDYLRDTFQNTSRIPDLTTQIGVLNDKINQLSHQQSTAFISIADVPNQGVNFLRIQRDIRVGTEVSEFLRLQYEQALLDEQKINSNLYMVDPPKVAEKTFKPARTKSLFIVMFITVVLSLIMIRLFDFWVTNRQRFAQIVN